MAPTPHKTNKNLVTSELSQNQTKPYQTINNIYCLETKNRIHLSEIGDVGIDSFNVSSNRRKQHRQSSSEKGHRHSSPTLFQVQGWFFLSFLIQITTLLIFMHAQLINFCNWHPGDKGICFQQILVDWFSNGYLWSNVDVEGTLSSSCMYPPSLSSTFPILLIISLLYIYLSYFLL